MIKNTTKRQKLGWVIFIVYLIFLAYFLFFSEDFGRGSHLQEEYAYNLVPFNAGGKVSVTIGRAFIFSAH